MLWMNGTEVRRRPVRSHPRRWHYDEYDVSAPLENWPEPRRGSGDVLRPANSICSRRPACSGVGADALLAVEGHLGDTELLTNGEVAGGERRPRG